MNLNNGYCLACASHPLGLCQPCWTTQDRLDTIQQLETVLALTHDTVYSLAARGDYAVLDTWRSLQRRWTRLTTPTRTISVLKPWT